MDAVEALRLVNRLYDRLAARRPDYTEREEYFGGKQPLSFATEEWKKANAQRYSGFSDNWTAPVANATAERIKHSGLKLDNNQKGADLLWDKWLLNEMEMQSSQGFLSSVITNTSYVLVWGTDDEPEITWQHPGNVAVEYDPQNPLKRRAALKTWVDDSLEFATLYTADEVWKFQRGRLQTQLELTAAQRAALYGTGGWEPRHPATDDTWPLPNPLGEVPVVEVPNRPLLGGDPISEIEGVMPMQDFINLMWAYLALSADYASMPARVVLHQGPPMMPILDDKGKKIGEKPVDIKDLQEKRLLYLSGKDTEIGSWEAARLDVFTDVIETAVGHISSQTRTPPTYLVSKTGLSNVNSEGLKASEIPLNKKVLEFQTFATPALREVYRLTALAMNDKELAKQVRRATISWMNPEIRSESQMADALLKKKQMGYPLEYLMEIDGLDPVEVRRVMGMVVAQERELMMLGVQAAVEDDGGAVTDS